MSDLGRRVHRRSKTFHGFANGHLSGLDDMDILGNTGCTIHGQEAVVVTVHESMHRLRIAENVGIDNGKAVRDYRQYTILVRQGTAGFAEIESGVVVNAGNEFSHR